MNVTFVSASVGLVIALAVGILATVTRMDRDRALYPAMLIMIAALYGLFGAIDGTPGVIATEVAGMAPFAVLALLGFRRSLWIVVFALAGHGVYDLVHPRIVTDTGVPAWWPVFCLAYDVTAALYLAVLLRRSTVPARFRH
jgi:drug/metabolite transporter (DMT)-like permease